jgi:hypothetical protein
MSDNDLSCIEESIFYPVERQPTPTKTAIVIPLDQLQPLMETYCQEKANDSTNGLRRLFLSNFIAWMKNRVKETTK